MPLMHGKSKKAFSHNVEAEMHTGKPQPQALAIAYSMKRRKKKAQGGEISAKSEKRPMPDDEYNDAKDVSSNSHKKDNGQDGWTDRPDIAQSQNRPKSQPIKHPKMVPSDAFSTRLYDQEGNLTATLHPANPSEKPNSWMDEEGPDRQGPKVPDMQPEHSTGEKAYAKGGEIEPSDRKHPKNPFEDDHLEHLDPSEDEGDAMAMSEDEEDQDKPGHPIRDMEREHNNGKMPYARGGHVSPADEEDMDHEDSIASAIMAKRSRHPAAMSDSDIDEMVMLYDGGEVLESEHVEEPNNEDQMSFQALKKENYNSSDLDVDDPMDSGEHGDDIDSDDHDMTSAIRSKMKAKRQFKAR